MPLSASQIPPAPRTTAAPVARERGAVSTRARLRAPALVCRAADEGAVAVGRLSTANAVVSRDHRKREVALLNS